MDDPLNRAFAEAPRREDQAPREVSEHRTRAVHALADELNGLRAQLLATMASPFFDEGAQAEIIPVVKHGALEVGTVKVTARRREPPYEAVASIEVRCEHDGAASEPDAGRYEVRAKVAVTTAHAAGRTGRERVFAVHEIDGGLQLDSADLKEQVAEVIREIGKPG